MPYSRVTGIVCKVLSALSAKILVLNIVMPILIIGLHSKKYVTSFVTVNLSMYCTDSDGIVCAPRLSR